MRLVLLQLSSRCGCGLCCEDVRSSSAAAQPRIGVWWYERRHVPCTTLPLLSARRAGAVQLKRLGVPRCAASTGGDGGTNAPRRGKQTLLRAYWALAEVDYVLLCALVFSVYRSTIAHALPVLVLAGNVWPINISTSLNVTLFFPDPFDYVGSFCMLAITGVQCISL